MVYNYVTPRKPIGAMYSSPGPCYGLPTLVGQVKYTHDPRSVHFKHPAWTFGHSAVRKSATYGPGPAYMPNRKMYRDGMDGTPHYSMTARRPELKGLNTPGPGAYKPEKYASTYRSAPQYSICDRSRLRALDKTPAPNSYKLPGMLGSTVQSTKRQMPMYSMRPTVKNGHFSDDLAKAPGPGKYNATDPSTYKKKLPQYSIGVRAFPPGDLVQKPGPGAHRPEAYMHATKSQAPAFYMGIRHSPYTTPIIVEPSS